jgi:curved DNA-binding protein CbpA
MAIKGNFYNIFGISPNASDEEVQEKYRELSLQHHSDRGGNDEEMQKIVNAYEVLGNPHQRLKYDLSLLKNGSLDFSEYIESEK